MKTLLLSALLLLCFNCQASSVFEQYPAEVITPEVTPDVWKQTDLGKQFRTRFTHAIAEGPNFAGHYVLIQWGCGTECQEFAIVDAISGELVSRGFNTRGGIDYRVDSLILEKLEVPITDENGNIYPEYRQQFFVWQNDTLTPLDAADD